MGTETYKIIIYDEVGGESAISVDDGSLIFDKIDKALKKGLTVELDFQNIGLIITAFLNAAIGQLYNEYKSDFLQENLKLKNVKPEDSRLFNKVIERAKEYFADPKGFESKANDVIYGG